MSQLIKQQEGIDIYLSEDNNIVTIPDEEMRSTFQSVIKVSMDSSVYTTVNYGSQLNWCI